MIDALTSDDPAHRTTALGAAARLNIFGREMLETALRDPDPGVRRRAVELAARLDPDRVPPRWTAGAVRHLLEDPTCAEMAAFTLGELDVTDGAVVDALAIQALDHDDPLCREAAVAALGALGGGREAVLAATTDVATVRRRAVIALANFDGDDITAALRSALDDRDWQVRQAAEDLLHDGDGPDPGDDGRAQGGDGGGDGPDPGGRRSPRLR
ncbi:MAG: hypothetical protein ACFCVK_04835 [Acidimicrobiales bacterium]